MIPQTANQKIAISHDFFFCSKYSFKFEFIQLLERREIFITFYSRTNLDSIHLAGGSQSWSSRSMRERQERHFIGYRRHSYPNIARDFVYRQMDDESSVDEMNSLSNLLRMGLTTRDESPPANVASDPRELPMQQQQQQGSNYRWLMGSARNRSHIKRYRIPRSLSRTSRISAERRRSLSLISRRNNTEYSSESDEEPMEQSSQINCIIERNYPIGSIIKLFIIVEDTCHDHEIHVDVDNRHNDIHDLGRLRHVNSGRHKRRF
uniref:Uncharacterized protein n=1 Tax=Wuchereria bancrofti TaxID=6293 RepID=A0AAF5Q3L9_WUCBA